MSTPTYTGTIYTPANASELRDQMLADYRLECLNNGLVSPAISEGTEIWIRFNAIAYTMLGVYANIANYASDTNELTASGDALDNIREAIGLPEVVASAAAGKLIAKVSNAYTSGITFTDGTEFVLSNGLRGQVYGTQSGITNGASIDVLMIDTGDSSNADAGTVVTWVSPPVGCYSTATVDPNGLTGGYDDETDDRKRARILNRRQNPPGGGNSGHVIELAEGATVAVQKAFVYPALGGPGSAKCVVIKEATAGSYTRQLPDAQVLLAAAAIDGELPEPMEMVIQSAVDEPVDVALQLQLPNPASSGVVNGWTNYTNVFPQLGTGETEITVASVSTTQSITIAGSVAITPVNGTTKILWWAPIAKQFVEATVTTATPVSGGWSLALDTPLIVGSETVTAGDYISPSCANADEYAETWVEEMGSLGPGENTEDANRLPHAYRIPATSDSYPSDLGTAQLATLIGAHTKIRDAVYSSTSKTSPTVPSVVSTAPNVLTLRNFGIYKKL